VKATSVPIVIPGREQARAQIDDGGDRGEDDRGGRHPPTARELGTQLQVDQAGRRRGEPLDQRRAGAGGAGEQHAPDRQRLVDGDVEVGQLALLGRGDRAPHAGDPAGSARSTAAARAARPA
jgi:hypothetical protein